MTTKPHVFAGGVSPTCSVLSNRAQRLIAFGDSHRDATSELGEFGWGSPKTVNGRADHDALKHTSGSFRNDVRYEKTRANISGDRHEQQRHPLIELRHDQK